MAGSAKRPKKTMTTGKQQTLTNLFVRKSKSTPQLIDKCRSGPRLMHSRGPPPARKSSFSACPLCNRSFPLHLLQLHASSCTGDADKSADKFKRPSREPIPGLLVFDDFITEEEEEEILKDLDGLSHEEEFQPWVIGNFNGPHYGKRWGVHCNLRDRKVSAPERPMASFLTRILLPKLKQLGIPSEFSPNEANAISYERKLGHHLQHHVDDRKLSKEPIANLSLAGDCYMTYRNQAPKRNVAVAEKRVLLKRRCLQVLTGKARYDFSHGIAHEDLLSDRRVSVTMRESPLSIPFHAQRKGTKRPLES